MLYVCIITGNTCTVGVCVYDENNEVKSPGGWWYLNLKKPNSVSRYGLVHYDLKKNFGMA